MKQSANPSTRARGARAVSTIRCGSAARSALPALAAAVAVVLALTACSSGTGSGTQSGGPNPQSNDSSASGTGASTNSEAKDVDYEQIPIEDAAEAGNVVKATREMGLRLLATGEPGETLVTSPASAAVALTMMGVGAEGETDEQLSALIGASGQQRDQAVNALVGTLDPYRVPVADIDTENLPTEPQVHLANQVAVDDEARILDTYLEGVKRWFDAGVLETDLGSAAGKKALDEWVNENTAGLIKESAIRPSADLRLVLQNAVLFASTWGVNMGLEYEPRDFAAADGRAVSTEFIATIDTLNYAEMDGWQMVEIPYGIEGDMIAQFVLPPAGTDPATVTAGDLAVMTLELAPKVVDFSAPKVDLSTSFELAEPLKQIGLTSVFSDTPPPLTNISTAQVLVLDQASQQGRLVMDEVGTLAAAVTELGFVETAAPLLPETEVEFTADRPYLVFIQDKTVGWDLFQILVNDPTAE